MHENFCCYCGCVGRTSVSVLSSASSSPPSVGSAARESIENMSEEVGKSQDEIEAGALEIEIIVIPAARFLFFFLEALLAILVG
jgi:hypothetical protein